jgi:hypothetical protein
MVTLQQLPLGDFIMIPEPISSTLMSPPLTVNFELGVLIPIPTLPEVKTDILSVNAFSS